MTSNSRYDTISTELRKERKLIKMMIYVKCLVLIVWLWLCLAVSPEGVLCAVGMNLFLLVVFGGDGNEIEDSIKFAFVYWLIGFILFMLLWITHIVHLTWAILFGYTMTMATLSVRNIFGWKSWFLPYGIIELFGGGELEPIKEIDLSWLPRINPATIVFIILLLALFNR